MTTPSVLDAASFLGYGFDIYGDANLSKGLKKSIVKTNANVVSSAATTPTTYHADGYSSRSEVEEQFKAAVGVKYSGVAFSGEFDASYSSGEKDQTQSTYGLCDIVVPETISVLNNVNQHEWSDDFTMDTDAKNLPDTFEGNEEIFFGLFRNYGTHYVTQVTFGGRLRATSISEASDSYSQQDAAASMKAEYDALLSDASGEASTDWTHVNKDWFSSRSFDLVVLGGDPSLVANAHAYGDSQQGEIKAWIASVAEKPDVAGFVLAPLSSLLSGKQEAAMEKAMDAYLSGIVRVSKRFQTDSYVTVGKEIIPMPAFSNPTTSTGPVSKHWMWLALLDLSGGIGHPRVVLNQSWNLEVEGGIESLVRPLLADALKNHQELTVVLGGELIFPDGEVYPCLQALTELNNLDLQSHKAGPGYNLSVCYLGTTSPDPYAATSSVDSEQSPLLVNAVNALCTPVAVLDQTGTVM